MPFEKVLIWFFYEFVKVLFASGYSFHDEAEEIFKEGRRGFLQKPFSKDELSRTLREVIEEKSIH